MNEIEPQEHTAGTIDRRDMLKRSAFVVGAAVVWSTPVVQSLGTRAAYASTGTPPEAVCPNDRVNITDAVFQYTGEGPVDVTVVVRNGGGANPNQGGGGNNIFEVCFSGVTNGTLLRVSADDLVGRDDLNNEVDFYINGELVGGVHTSCSQPFETNQMVLDRVGNGPSLFTVRGARDSGGTEAGDPDAGVPPGGCTPTTSSAGFAAVTAEVADSPTASTD